jgi:hypothetical protein
MAKKKALSRKQVLTRDTFTDVLALKRFGARLQDRQENSRLYTFLIEFLASEGLINELEANVETGSLSFMIPGTPVHVRLGGLWQDAITDVVMCYLLLQHAAQTHPLIITAALVKDLAKHLSKLHVKRGERCVIESIAEVVDPTDHEICLNLSDTPCRYPTSGCQYQKRPGMCCVTLDDVGKTLENLERRNIVEKSSVTDPRQWRVRV